jgi:hypothetical protein
MEQEGRLRADIGWRVEVHREVLGVGTEVRERGRRARLRGRSHGDGQQAGKTPPPTLRDIHGLFPFPFERVLPGENLSRKGSGCARPEQSVAIGARDVAGDGVRIRCRATGERLPPRNVRSGSRPDSCAFGHPPAVARGLYKQGHKGRRHGYRGGLQGTGGGGAGRPGFRMGGVGGVMGKCRAGWGASLSIVAE